MKRSMFISTVLAGLAVAASAAEPVTMEKCVRTALAASPDIQSASHRLEAARAAITEAASAWYPQLGANGTYGRTDNPPQAFFMSLNQRIASMQKDFNNPADTENMRASVTAKWLLLDGGQRSSSQKMASAGAAAAGESLAGLKNDIIFLVARGYYGALQAKANIQVQEEAIQSLSESLRVADERKKAGAALESDILSIEVQLAQARQDLIRASNGFALAVAVLNTTVGRDIVDAGSFADAAPGTVPEPPVLTAPAKEAVNERAELRAAKLNAEMSKAALEREKAEYLPTLSAFGSMDWDNGPDSQWEQSYMVGLMVDWKLFTGFRRGAAVTGARERYEGALSDSDKAKKSLELDVIQARLQVSETSGRLSLAGKGTVAATEALRLTQERYKQGAADLGELLNARLSLTAMRSGQIAAHYEYLSALVNLDRAGNRLLGKYEESGKFN